MRGSVKFVGLEVLTALVVLVLGVGGGLSQEEVTFADANLEAAIRDALDKATGPITDAELAGLTELDGWGRGIANLSGIEHCVNMQRLHLWSYQIRDLSPLAGLVNLRFLYLQVSRISDLSPLAGLVNLEVLWLWDNQISDLSPLAGLVNLQVLWAYGEQISDLSPLAGLVNLQDLWLWNNQISDLSPLAGLVKLEKLWLCINEISDVGALAGLTALATVYLDGNQIQEIGPLAGLTAIGTSEWVWPGEREGIPIHLGLSNNQISDLTALVSNPGIDAEDGVDLRGNPLSQEACETQIPALQARGVRVLFDACTNVQADAADALPAAYRLCQNHPNPFNPFTIIAYDLPEATPVQLSVYSLTAQQIATLVCGRQEAGTHQVAWSGTGLSSGVYLYRLEAGGFRDTKKMVLVK